MKHVFVAVPVISSVHPAMTEFLLALPAMRAQDRFTVHVLGGRKPVDFARNSCVGTFLRSSATHLWFLDADLVPEPGAAAMLDVEADLVSGRYLMLARPNDGLRWPCVAVFDARDPLTGGYRTVAAHQRGVVDALAAGTGCLLIARAVFARPAMHLEPTYIGVDGQRHDVTHDEEDALAPPFFRTRYAPNGRVLMTEDVDFCERALAAGFRLKYAADASFGHQKSVDLRAIEKMLARACGDVGFLAGRTPAGGRTAAEGQP